MRSPTKICGSDAGQQHVAEHLPSVDAERPRPASRYPSGTAITAAIVGIQTKKNTVTAITAMTGALTEPEDDQEDREERELRAPCRAR